MLSLTHMERFLLRGLRGATTVSKDDAGLILAATKELLEVMLEQNQITDFDLIASIFFTTTPDLSAAFPAEAARAVGMKHVALMCSREIPVENSLKKAIRILMHFNTKQKQSEIKHIYLHNAKKLRPDLVDD